MQPPQASASKLAIARAADPPPRSALEDWTMGTLRLKYKRVSVTEEYGHPSSLNTLTPLEFKQFNVGLLGLGQVKKQASVINALAAVFDLEGFTDFCSQIDPQLVVPEFLSEFLAWLFESVRTKFTEKEAEEVVRIWGSLPFFGKFTGDGVLFLWDTDLSGGAPGIGHIARKLKEICNKYSDDLQPRLAESLAKTPKRLRVGIARGQVLSIGDGNDFVGPCINMAARLQKLGSLSFAVSRRGFDPKECFKDFVKQLVLKKLPIRGVGEDEPVLLLKNEFEALSDEDKAQFS
jgi:class 3 adenylate cyclase